MSNPDIIVDDADPSIVYTGLWTQYTNTDSNVDLAGSMTFFNNTFHVNTGDAALSFPFNGSSIVVRGSFPGDSNVINDLQYPDCRVDGQTGSFSPSVAPVGGQWICSFSRLDKHLHNLTIQTRGVTQQLFRIDYIHYTPPEDALASVPADLFIPVPNLTSEKFDFGSGWMQPKSGPVLTWTSNSTVFYEFNGTFIAWWGACFEPEFVSGNVADATYNIDGTGPVPFQINATSVLGRDCAGKAKLLFGEYSLTTPGPHNLTVTYLGDINRMPLSLYAVAYTTTASALKNETISLPSPSTSRPSYNPVPTPSIPEPAVESSSTSSMRRSPHRIGIIVGSVVGTIAFACLLIFMTLFFLRRRRRLKRSSSHSFDFNTIRPGYNTSKAPGVYQPSMSSATHKPGSTSIPASAKQSSSAYNSQQTAQLGSNEDSESLPNESFQDRFVLAPNRKDPKS